MQPTKQETKLYEAVTKAALQGRKIEPGTFGEENTDWTGEVTGSTVCLCGAVLAAAGLSIKEIQTLDIRSGADIIRTAARKLGITIKQAASLNNGFEGEPRSEQEVTGAYNFEPSPLAKGVDSKWYNIGKALRKEYESRETTV